MTHGIPMRAARHSAGFTLLEMLVVLVIIGLIASLVGPRLFERVDSSKVQVAETQTRLLRGAVETFRLEVGPRDVAGGVFVLKPPLARSKAVTNLVDVSPEWLRGLLADMHAKLFERAKAYRDANTHTASTYDELKSIIAEKGGFVRCFFKQGREAEQKIKDETKATVRCVPLEQTGERGTCIYSGEETDTQVLFAMAY